MRISDWSSDVCSSVLWFEYLFLIVAILALATAARFYFVSWLGERVVADIRSATQANLLRQEPRFFEENRPSEIASRMTADTAIIDQVVGSTVSIALRNVVRSEEHTSELQSLMRISYAVFCLKKKQ